MRIMRSLILSLAVTVFLTALICTWNQRGSQRADKPIADHDLQANTQEQAIAEITKQGGKVLRNESEPDKPIEQVTLDRTQDTNVSLKQLRFFLKLNNLQVSQTQVSKNGLQQLKALTSLKKLTFYDIPMADDDLSNLANLTFLNSLCIGHCGISNSGLEHIHTLTNI